MTKDKNLYTESSIESLSPLEFTRLRPQVYAGDCTYSTQLLVEIFSNAVDEHNSGHGDRIEVSINKDEVAVRDYGQGFITNSFRDDGETILQAAFDVLNTSGKYREDGTYEGTSLGSFGIGSKITTFLSHWLKVKTVRDNKWEECYFKEGVFDKRTCGAGGITGTLVEWKPSEEFFTNTIVEISKIKNLFKTTACLCPGLTIVLTVDGKTEEFRSESGLNDLVDEAVKDKEIINNRMSMNWEDGKNKLDFVLTYTSNYNGTIIPYVNTGLTESGQHITQVKGIITRVFNKFFKEKKWLKEKDENLTGDDIQEGIYVVFNIKAPNIGYDAQVKSRITKIDMAPFSAVLTSSLEEWLELNEKEIKTIADKSINARKAREAAKKAREKAREGNKQKKNKLLNLPTKLVDANSKNREKCEIMVCEGDSAAGGLIESRDPEYTAIFPIRGKMINSYKHPIDKILGNAEINNLINALGLEFDAKHHTLIYDKKTLRYGKILTACDADADGKAIKNLILVNLWSLCPELIINGHVWVTIPPLYRITKGKDTYIYLKDDAELEEYKKAHQGEKYLVNRNKGLGEQDAEELERSLLNPETRSIAQITVEDVQKAEEMFDILMGTRVPPRREWLLAHSEEADENLW